MDNNIKRVSIICGYPFPDGLAPTIRILAYAKGLVQNGVDVDVYVYFPSDNQKSEFPVNGSIDGVKYHYPNTRKYPRNILLRKFSHFYYMFITGFNYRKEHKNNPFDLAIISSDWFRILYFFIPLLTLLKIKKVFIADEYPVPIRVYLKNKLPYLRKILFRIILKKVEGMIFMTYNLKEFYNAIVIKPSFILPSITDLSRFSENEVRKSTLDYICYMGNMELSKDNVDNIIEAFNLIHYKYPTLELHLYGAPNDKDLQIINLLINKYNLSKKVIFKGKVSNKEVVSILKRSKLLVSSQPDTKRAQGGFPTKLGEYMATGVPTVVTNVGEISKYVTHGVNGWLAKPEDAVDYSLKIEYILDNYSHALEIANKGKDYVFENFNNKTITKEMICFLNKL